MKNFDGDPNDRRLDTAWLGSLREASTTLAQMLGGHNAPSRDDVLSAVGRMLEAARGTVPALDDVGLKWVEGLEGLAAMGPLADPEGPIREVPVLKDARDAFERAYLRALLRRTRGNVTAAARAAGRNRTDFYELLHRRRVSPREFKGGV